VQGLGYREKQTFHHEEHEEGKKEHDEKPDRHHAGATGWSPLYLQCEANGLCRGVLRYAHFFYWLKITLALPISWLDRTDGTIKSRLLIKGFPQENIDNCLTIIIPATN
jgi:hypothetical protein